MESIEFSLENYELMLLNNGIRNLNMNEGNITINIEDINGDIFKIKCFSTDIIYLICLKIENKTGSKAEHIKLYHNRTVLEKTKTLEYYGIKEGMKAEILIPMRTEQKRPYHLQSILSPNFDYDFRKVNDGNTIFQRGGKVYTRPCGSLRVSLNVSGKYDNGNDTWLGDKNINGEWCVAYHGTHCNGNKDIKIWADRLKIEQKCGIGVFCTPNFKLALDHSEIVTTPDGKKRYKIIFQHRVNPNTIQYASSVGGPNDFWFFNNPSDIRPYQICLFEMK